MEDLPIQQTPMVVVAADLMGAMVVMEGSATVAVVAVEPQSHIVLETVLSAETAATVL